MSGPASASRANPEGSSTFGPTFHDSFELRPKKEVRARNTDKQFLEFCSTFSGALTGTRKYNDDQDYNGIPPAISTTDPWGLKPALRRQVLVLTYNRQFNVVYQFLFQIFSTYSQHLGDRTLNKVPHFDELE